MRVGLQRRNTSRVSSLLGETPVQLLRYSIPSYDIPSFVFDYFIMAVDNWWSNIPQYYSRPWWAGFIRRRYGGFHTHPVPSTYMHLPPQHTAIAKKRPTALILNSRPGHSGLTLVDKTNLRIGHNGHSSLDSMCSVGHRPCTRPPASHPV